MKERKKRCFDGLKERRKKNNNKQTRCEKPKSHSDTRGGAINCERTKIIIIIIIITIIIKLINEFNHN